MIRIYNLSFRILLIVFLSFMFKNDAISANWVKLSEVAELQRFGKTEYYVDIESIKREGDIRTVWLKSVFSKPQEYKEGKTFTEFLSFTHFNCSNKTQAITQIDAYSSDEKLVGSEKQDIKYAPISDGSLDDSMYKYICGYVIDK
ncbi:hypothetical protein MYX76_03465 [Desulfobacterota bacterium AH_259_B03_O07]|nr:hypothetical protein [Desulfobacterota bacterium AH_259_B03_O07]